MAPKPSIVIVPGAWHSPAHFAPTIALLESAGYAVHPVTLPSVGASPALANWDPDVAAIRSVVETAIGPNGNPVVILAHSYGGLPTQDAIHDLDLPTRQSLGQPGGVIRLIYLAAFIGDVGQSLLEHTGNKPSPWIVIDSETDTALPSNPLNTFYHDVPAPLADVSASALRPHSLATFRSTLARPPPWKRVPTTYIVCEGDRASAAALQEARVAAVRRDPEGKVDAVERVGASHSPFLSVPEWMAGAVRRACGEEVGKL